MEERLWSPPKLWPSFVRGVCSVDRCHALTQRVNVMLEVGSSTVYLVG